MAGRNSISAGVKDQGFPSAVSVLLDLAHKNDVITTVILLYFAAQELGNDPLQ
jgi:hypothetical protein